MQKMIKTYEMSRIRLQQRIHELNNALRDDTIRHREREELEQRRDMLVIETIELLRVINDLRRHCA